MNKIVSVPSGPQLPKNRPETPPPSVPITSLSEATKFVEAQDSLSTEMLFKTLLMYNRPNQSMFATRRDPEFLAAAINKNSSQGSVSEETQQKIALAISNGEFGDPTMPENVALAIATNLDTFTDPEAQRNIAVAIYTGTFGTQIREAVALAIAANLVDTFTDPEAQRNIIFAFRDGKFGKPIPQAVALAIAAKLSAFTAVVAQPKNSPASVWITSLEEAMKEESLSTEDLFKKLLLYRKPDPDQGWFASFPWSPTPRDSRFLTDVISKNYSQSDVSVKTQREIARAICDGKFGTPIPEDVARAIAAKLDAFTDPQAQRNIASDISDGRFGNRIRPEVALAIAAKLDTFTDPAAQKTIARAILEEKFSPTLRTLPPEGKAAIMSFLKKVSLREAIKNFDRLSALMGESPEFKQSALQAVALPLVQAYTEAETVLQQYEAVKNLATGVAKFKCDAPPTTLPNAFARIASNLEDVLKFPHEDIATCFPGFQALIDGTQEFKGLIESLAAAIAEKTALLADDSATDDDKLAASQRITNSAEAVKSFHRTAPAFTGLGTLEATITTAAAKLAHLEPDLASELASQLRPVPFGAQTVPMTSQTIAHLSELAKVDLTYIFEDNQEMTYLLYGTQDAQRSELPGAAATDATSKRPKLLLTYDCSTHHAARADFQGWLSDYSVFYKATAQNVKVYDVSGEPPVLLDIRDDKHASFQDLPLFMCKAITNCSFDITAYRHRDELDLIFGEEGILPLLRSQHAGPAKLALIDKMQSIIQTCIAQAGDSVSIAASTADDQALKDAMNQLCTRETMDPVATMAPFIAKLETLLAGIDGSPTEKEATYSRLAFLFGQLAKKGVLGYHHGSNNTANDLFYTLSATCFRKLSSHTLPETDLQTLLRDIDKGTCIEVITKTFLRKCPAVAEIWSKR